MATVRPRGQSLANLSPGWYAFKTDAGQIGIVLHHKQGSINLGGQGKYGKITSVIPVSNNITSTLPSLLSSSGPSIQKDFQSLGATPKQAESFITQADTAAGQDQGHPQGGIVGFFTGLVGATPNVGGHNTTQLIFSRGGTATAKSGKRSVSTTPHGDIQSVGASAAIGGIPDFLAWIAWLFNPLNWLRLGEMILGVILFMSGLYFLFQRRPLASTGAGIARVTSQLAAATPVGRATNVRRGRRQGRREGQIEEGRLAGRRQGRTEAAESRRMPRAEVRETQRRGQARAEGNRSN